MGGRSFKAPNKGIEPLLHLRSQEGIVLSLYPLDPLHLLGPSGMFQPSSFFKYTWSFC
jgi:hypothetical protein